MPAVPVPALTGVDFIRDPQVIAQQMAMLYGLRNLNVQLVIGQASQLFKPGISQITGSPPNLVLPLPLMLASPIANSTATAASVSAQLNLLLSALRATTQLPT